MNIKRIPGLIGASILLCGALVYLVGSLRPLAPSPRFINPAPFGAAQAPPVTQAFTPRPISTSLARTTRIAQATTAPTETPAPDLRAASATQTSVLAVQTLNAIATRARSTPAPRAREPLHVYDKTTNFLLIGTDTRTADPAWRPNTDVMMVLLLDSANRRAALLSLPRDLLVAIPGHQAFRLNAAYSIGWEQSGPEGGVAILKQILANEFGIRIDHWALIDFNGLNKIIDTLGGITVEVPCPLQDTIDEQAFTIPAGTVQMDYLTAKRYVQSRYTTSDTSRNYRQQRVVWAMASRALELNVPDRIPLLYEQLKDSVATNMTLFDMVGLVPAVYQLDLKNHPERLRAQVLQPPAVYPWISTTGAWLYMPDYDLIQKTLDEIFDAPQVAAHEPTAGECPPTAPTPHPTDVPTATP